MRHPNSSNWSQSFGEKDISSQFQGMEVEFNDKVTLFPVQVEKRDIRSRNRSNVRRLRG